MSSFVVILESEAARTAFDAFCLASWAMDHAAGRATTVALLRDLADSLECEAMRRCQWDAGRYTAVREAMTDRLRFALGGLDG